MSDYGQGRADERRDTMALLREAIANRPEHEATLRDIMLAIASGAHDTGGAVDMQFSEDEIAYAHALVGYPVAIDYRAAFERSSCFRLGNTSVFHDVLHDEWEVRHKTKDGESRHECADRETAYRRACELAGVEWRVKR